MTELDLLEVIGYAQTVHILDAEEMPVAGKKRFKVRIIAVILALVLAAMLLMFGLKG